MTIKAITESLSTDRFATYQLPILGGTSQEQCLGIYLWNKQLASAFLPALQIIEISLRNAIYQSWIAHEEDQIELNFQPKGHEGRFSLQWKPLTSHVPSQIQ